MVKVMHHVQFTEDKVALGSACPTIGCRHQYKRPWNGSIGTTLAPRVRICTLPVHILHSCALACGWCNNVCFLVSTKEVQIGILNTKVTKQAFDICVIQYCQSVASGLLHNEPSRGHQRSACTNILILGPSVSFFTVWKRLSCAAPSFSDSCRVFSNFFRRGKALRGRDKQEDIKSFACSCSSSFFSKHAPPCSGGHRTHAPLETWRAMKETTSVVIGGKSVGTHVFVASELRFLRSGTQDHDQTCNSTTARDEKTQPTMKHFVTA